MTPSARNENLAALLLRGFRWFDDGLLALLADAGFAGLTRAQSLVFAYLDPRGSRLSEVARRVGVSRQAVHLTAKEMVAAGLVTLEDDATNRSAKLIVPTEHGRASMRAAARAFARLERELARRVGTADAAALRRVLEADWGPPPGARAGA